MNNKIDYSIFYKQNLEEHNGWASLKKWDLFISAYNSSPRVLETYDKVYANNKHWLIFPEYQYTPTGYPKNQVSFGWDEQLREDEFFHRYLSSFDINPFMKNMCIDITGFIRPHLIYFIRRLYHLGIKKIDILYSEPISYSNNDETFFSDTVDFVQLIPGCYADEQELENENDVLIIASGYDNLLISKVAQEKRHCKNKFQILGFPPLQPDMYQESILRASKAQDDLGDKIVNYFAPANDPFITAQIIQEIINKNNYSTSNIYLCPLSTKAQTLGFIIYYIWEGIGSSKSIIFPYSKNYSKKTTDGLSRTWLYTVELP